MKFGIDIGGTKIAGAVIGADGREIAATRLPNPKGDYAGTIANVAAVTRTLCETLGVALDRLGVCVSGNVQGASGEVRLGTARWINGHPFRDDIAAAVGAPVRLANDADCFALSEAADGAGAGLRSVFGVILGTGVGGGFVVEGRLVTGARGIAGEWGHIPLPRAAADELAAGPCSCGRFGCLETLLSGGALAAEFTRVTGRAAADARAVAALAEAGDAQASAAFDRYEERLGRALAMVVNLIEPDAFVFGGGVSNVARIYANTPALMTPHVFGGVCETRLLRNAHGDSSGVRGAARLWDH
ncbi:MAG: fructokinase [Rhodobacterales bacterium CG_4_9_14_3_um_filter_71_31]|nr:MAG: fructokinase [Rhodobacterales bacterium CG_4_9_14_3_um_filter_71_31]